MLVEIGLATAKEGYREGGSDELKFRSLEGLRVLTVIPPDDLKTGDVFTNIISSQGILQAHSDDVPSWVSVPERPGLQALLAEHWSCAEGKPDDVEQTHYTQNGPPGVDGSQPAVEVPTEAAPETVAA